MCLKTEQKNGYNKTNRTGNKISEISQIVTSDSAERRQPDSTAACLGKFYETHEPL